MLEYKAKNKRTKETLLTCLADLFYSIVTQKRKVIIAPCTLYTVHCTLYTQNETLQVGTIAPKKFIARLRKEKVEFDNYMQQVLSRAYPSPDSKDAHDILTFLTNASPGCPRVPDLPDQPHQ